MELLRDLTIKKMHDGLLNKEFSALEIAQAEFKHIKEHNPEINAYLSTAEESAVREAEAVDLAIAKDEDIPLLGGVPLAIKDNILIKGLPATAASKILEDYTAAYDAGVIEKLKRQKAVFLGKANLDEFAMGSSTENSAFGVTRNPRDTSRVAGGSSGGSAAAVAAHLAVAALGSDTGGSIRLPANFCGVVGMTPTYGAVSRSGVIAMASSLDQVGPITKTVEDAAILLAGIAGHDPLDGTSSDYFDKKEAREKLLAPKLEDVKKLVVGLPEEYFIPGTDKAVSAAIESAIDKLKSLGVQFKKVSLPHTKYALSTYYIIVPAEVSSNLARFDGVRYGLRVDAEDVTAMMEATRTAGFGAEVKRRIMLGTYALSAGYYDAYYGQALKVRTLTINAFDAAYRSVDLLLGATTPGVAFKFGAKTADPMTMYLNDVFTIPTNLAGHPALSVPFGTGEEGLPVGVQLLGPGRSEAQLFAAARVLEIADGRP